MRPLATQSVPQSKEKARSAPDRGQDNFFRLWIPPVVVALFVIAFIVQLFEVPSGSMENTLLIGDHVAVDRVGWAPSSPWMHWLLPYRAPQRDAVVAFRSPVEPGTFLVKRVVGIPGDHIRLIHRVLYRNGQPVTEPYVIHQLPYDAGRDEYPDAELFGQTEAWQRQQWSYFHNGDIVVPPGHYFVMGDNRDDSFDSRYWGFVPASAIIGRPVLVYWSVRSGTGPGGGPAAGSGSLLSKLHELGGLLVHLPARTRWGRTLHVIR